MKTKELAINMDIKMQFKRYGTSALCCDGTQLDSERVACVLIVLHSMVVAACAIKELPPT